MYDRPSARLEVPTVFRMPAPSREQLAASVPPSARAEYAAPGLLAAIVRAATRVASRARRGMAAMMLFAIAIALTTSGTAFARRQQPHTPRAAHSTGLKKPSTLARATQAAKAKARATAGRVHHRVKARVAAHHARAKAAKPVKKHHGAR